MKIIIPILGLIMFFACLPKKKSKSAIYFILLSGWVITFAYTFWRVTAVPLQKGWLSFAAGVILLAAECLSLLTFLTFQYLFTGTYRPVKKSLEVYQDKSLPFVDVLIVTYNEPLYLLEMTIAAAVNLHYPNDRFCVYVCDDGHRDELRKLCRKFNVRYVSREGNEHAKAGNINHALTIIQGDLFAVLDADMIVKPQFLQRTVGYFEDEQMAFVQTPQVYYNQDVYQYHLDKKIPNEQDFFMRDIQSARAAKNAVLHVGTNALFRRSCIMEINGYPTCSITEDMAVGMVLQARGYRSLLINEELVYGLSASTLPELIKQRDRWCRGNLQVLRHYNPLFTEGLSFAQKIAYFDGVLYWFCNLQKMVFILCPILYLLFGMMALDSTLIEIACFYVPYLLAQKMISRVMTPHTRSSRWGHYYEMVMAPFLSVSVCKELFRCKTSFKVTSKETLHEERIFQYKFAFVHILLLVLTIVGWIVSLGRVLHDQTQLFGFLLNLFWSGYNMAGMIVAIQAAWEKPLLRKSQRVPLRETQKTIISCGDFETVAEMVDLSVQGCGLRLDEEYQRIVLGQSITMQWGAFLFSCRVVRCQKGHLALIFDPMSAQQRCFMMAVFCENMTAHFDVGKKQEYA